MTIPKALNKLIQRVSRVIQITGLKKKYHRNPSILADLFNQFSKSKQTLSLDIGSGPDPKNPFQANMVYGADLRENLEKNVIYTDLSISKLPFENESFDYVTAYDVLEHITRVSSVEGFNKFPFIELMNEVFRVLKPNGIFFNIQPCFPFKEAFQDPTHVNIMSEDTMECYFCELAWARIYGFVGVFSMENDGWIGSHYYSFMKKISSQSIMDINHEQKSII